MPRPSTANPNYDLFRHVQTAPATYAISNVENGRQYFGSTINLKHRLRKHFGLLSKGKHANRKLQADFDAYGLRAFEVYVLDHEKDGVKELVLIKLADDPYNEVGRVGHNICRFSHHDHREMRRMWDAGLMQTEIAEAFGTHKSYVCRVLGGKQAPSAVAMSGLYGEDGEIHPPETLRELVWPTRKSPR